MPKADKARSWYERGVEAVNYNSLSLKALALLAWEAAMDSNAAYDAVREAYKRSDIDHMVKAVKLFPAYFLESADYERDTYLSLFEICRLSVAKAVALEKRMRGEELEYQQVLEYVTSAKAPRMNGTRESLLDWKLRLSEFVVELEKENTNGAGMEVHATQLATAAKLRELFL